MNEFFPKVIKKRDGKVTPFNLEKIKTAIYKAAYTLGGRDEEKAVEVANEVARRLNNNFTVHNKIPTVDDSNTVCVEVLREKGFDRTEDKFESDSQDRSRVRRSGRSVQKQAG
ncbi:MAG: ATP cone domain-containing protein [Elusimicrobiota bacterium]|nr:ATP cone domain-containing protein [Elusimicrobiota bacterium]